MPKFDMKYISQLPLIQNLSFCNMVIWAGPHNKISTMRNPHDITRIPLRIHNIFKMKNFQQHTLCHCFHSYVIIKFVLLTKCHLISGKQVSMLATNWNMITIFGRMKHYLLSNQIVYYVAIRFINSKFYSDYY